MAPNGKPASFVMQHQRSPLQPSPVDVAPSKDSNIRVKNECILFSQSIMSGRWNPSTSVQAAESSSTTGDGPEPRILSKKRRDLINAEIRELQNLLPLKKSARERLSYLGILALTNTFIRKATFFKKECLSCDASMSCALVPEFSSSLCGFLLVFNREGKILYSSDNILDYLGNTVVELASQGDSVYDFVDKEDHDLIRAQLEVPPHDDRGDARRLSFYCRMSTSRYMKTQMRSWKNKIVHVTGRYHKPEMNSDWSDTVFFAVCTPVESKPVTDVRHHPSPRATEFKAVHGPDMKFLEVPNTVETLLGYKPEELENTSWYQWIYPEDLAQARQQHLKFVKEDGSAFACVLRMVKKDGSLVWVDVTAEKSQETIGSSFICNYIVIEEEEVPYFRIHHNLLPFPEHYTEAQRQYLAYRSTLLSAALNSEVNSASTSPMASPSGLGHPDAPPSHYAQQIFGDNRDTKSILRRQLIKRKMSSVDSPTGAPSPYGTEIFAVPPNKMLIRTASDMTYPTPVYHSPLQHSSSNPEATYHHPNRHVFYRPGFSEESFMAQLHGTNPVATAGYLYESGYTTLAPVRPDSLSLMQAAARSPAKSSSPVNGHATQMNQNNNVGMATQDNYHPSNYYSKQQYSPISQETEYHPSQGSPCRHPSQSPVSHSPHSPVNQQMSPVHASKRMGPSVDGLFHAVSEIIDGDYQSPTPSCMTSCQQSVARQQCSEAMAYTSPAQLCQHVRQRRFPSQHEQAAGICDLEAVHQQAASIHQSHIKREQIGSPQQYEVMSPARSVQYSPARSCSGSNFDASSPARCTPDFNNAEEPFTNLPYHVQAGEKPYQVRYSISPAHPSAMHQYHAAAAAAFYAATQQHPRINMVDGGQQEWMKKYGNMSATEMLFCESEGSPYLA